MKKTVKILAVVALLLNLILPAGSVWAASDSPNLLINPDFETGDETGWYPYGENHSIKIVSDDPQSGNYCAYVYDRTDEWNGIAQDVTDIIEVGKAYEFSAWVKVDAPGEHEVKITMKRVEGNNEPEFDTITVMNMTGNVWTRFSGSYSITKPATLLEVYVEGPQPQYSFYVDNIVMTEMYMNAGNWREIADQRIEQYRKRDASIKVVDKNGNPVSGATVEVKQTRNHFAFGSALRRSAMYDERYTKFFKENFEWAVFENEAKWYHTETSRGNVNYTDADYMYEWCKENDIIVRGHCIFWEVEDYVPSWVRSLSNTELKKAIDDRLESVVPHFRGKFVDWDVNNEMLHGSFFKDRLGQDIWLYMFNRTKELDPDTKLFVNDYNIITEAETDAYVQQINWFLENGVDLYGIGVQGHFSQDKVVDPVVVESRLNTLASTGLPIWITEYDSTTQDVKLRADNLENLYRIAFSHPSVEGILMWGFHADSHWRGPDAAIVNHDWTVNEAGLRYQALREEWRTNDSGTTNSSGNYTFRGFHGKYDVTISAPGSAPVSVSIYLEPGEGTASYKISLDGTVEELPPEKIKYGDLNNDGTIDSIDAAILVKYILEIDDIRVPVPQPPTVWKPADLNGDGFVDTIDLAILQRYILEIIVSFPVE
ncbi:endo-1,4-beta-xylanase [Acetivibrio saccincola]|jgi:GH35 family endo-1,4-beta-xylanase|uniref:Beta-xylanase n=1 Tax=Acetivibrio saccincola TaxID=1677857 RepID=A0A2K9E171_9FIRM|nr:endo-1,4-beta-xylanase [Acetivibrio saccincola]AUG57527.1 Endo-1,4-beta-xylanase A precursor [Acetivibrio saccincola]NLW26025.1 glycoside hydrolase [Acetivibrio saccincola]HOA96540.1 endo-1,4-beta-xylanase [Acetivibrio saccincola]HQD29952.1 endo-1,4-beta-xylanase [Acetivibrio saccincola]